MKLRGRVNKEGVFAYILIKDLHPNVFRQVEASIIAFPTPWMVESAFSAVVDVFSKKKKQIGYKQQRNYQIKTEQICRNNFDFLCQKHQSQVSH